MEMIDRIKILFSTTMKQHVSTQTSESRSNCNTLELTIEEKYSFRQGLSQDLDSRVSKMDFGGDRVSW